jgi:hypothetical protein
MPVSAPCVVGLRCYGHGTPDFQVDLDQRGPVGSFTTALDRQQALPCPLRHQNRSRFRTLGHRTGSHRLLCMGLFFDNLIVRSQKPQAEPDLILFSGLATNAFQAPTPDPRIIRDELSDFEWFGIQRACRKRRSKHKHSAGAKSHERDLLPAFAKLLLIRILLRADLRHSSRQRLGLATAVYAILDRPLSRAMACPTPQALRLTPRSGIEAGQPDSILCGSRSGAAATPPLRIDPTWQ